MIDVLFLNILFGVCSKVVSLWIAQVLTVISQKQKAALRDVYHLIFALRRGPFAEGSPSFRY